MTAPIRQVDHILVEAMDPVTVFGAMRSDLGLSVAWPLQPSGLGYESGGLFAGNTNIEVIKFDDTTELTEDPQFLGFALEPDPDIETAVAELTNKGILCGELKKTDAYTTVILKEFSSTPCVFLCEYHCDTSQWRSNLADEYSRVGRGTGVVRVSEIVVEVQDLSKSRRKWNMLLGAAKPGTNYWACGSGPAVQLVAGHKEQIRSLVVEIDVPPDSSIGTVEGLRFEAREGSE